MGLGARRGRGHPLLFTAGHDQVMNAGASRLNAGPGAAHGTQPATSVLVVRHAHELQAHTEAWESLAANASEPNVFHEPLMLLPTLEAFGAGRDLRCILVWLTSAGPRSSPAMGGFFPFVRETTYYRVPLPVLRLWSSDYTFLSTPLVRAGYEREVLAALFTWLGSAQNDTLFTELADIAGEGRLYRLLTERLELEGLTPSILASHTRAVLRRSASAEDYLAANRLSGKHRKELRRQSYRLADLGSVTYACIQPQDEVQPWIDEFLRLEASGWKGEARTALASRAADRAFFVAAATEAHRRGRLMLLALRLNDRTIAMKCNLRAADGAFAFKICFDESFANFSPGVMLELENIRRLHATPGLNWMDSCAVYEHFMINRLWTDRRIIQTVVVPTGKPLGQQLVAALPLTQSILRPIVRRLRPLAQRMRAPRHAAQAIHNRGSSRE
jgi:CelD/BcsL family acetyltransferase involved in cellulose biosynthesis